MEELLAGTSGRAFAVELTGCPGCGKTELLEALCAKLQSKGVDAQIMAGSKVPVASVILVDNWDSVRDGVRAAVYRHPRHVVVSCVSTHVKPSATVKLPPPQTDLGYILEIMRDELRGDAVGASRKVSRIPRRRRHPPPVLIQRSQAYLEAAVLYWFHRTAPPSVPVVAKPKEALEIEGPVAVSATSHPEVIFRVLATRYDVNDCYIVPKNEGERLALTGV